MLHGVQILINKVVNIEQSRQNMTEMQYLRNKSWKPECVGSFNMD